MASLMGNNARVWLHRVSSFILVMTLLLADVFVFLERGLFVAPEAQAAIGDFSIFREATGGTLVAGNANPVTFDTTVVEDTDIALQGNDSDIDLAEGGKYFVTYNAWTYEGTTGGADRRSVASYLTLNGSPLEYGWGGGYIRDSENDLTAYNTGAAIIEAAAGDDIALALDRDDSNASGGTAIRPDSNAISVLKLDDDLSYARLRKTVNSSDISGNTSFTAVDFDTTDELDTAHFGLAGASNIELSGAADQFFLVTTNVKLNSTVSGRSNYELRLTLDGVEVDGTRTSAYIRGSNGHLNNTLQYVGVIQKTASTDQVLQVQVRREGAVGLATTVQANETAIAIAALPDTVDVLSLSTGADQSFTAAQSTFDFSNQINGAANLSHSTSTNTDTITVDQGGNYLMFATSYISRTSGSGRDVPRIDWQIDGVTQSYGGHGSFNRGDQGTQDTFTAGASGGAIFSGLTGGQTISLTHQDETTGTPNSVFPAGRVAVQVVELASLNPSITTNVSINGNQTAVESAPQTGIFTGQQIVIAENDGARNITSITVNESGSVNAATDIANVRLLYDIDTTAPFDCSSESYAGTESQFGSNSTFSGPDGTVTFTDSESISQTAAFCGYIVYDTTPTARDGNTVNFSIVDPSSQIVVTADGLVAPGNTIGDDSQTVFENPEITQTNYHWRNDDGSETGATSATGGVENTPGLAFDTTNAQRLRIGVAGQGTGAESNQYRLEYGEKVGTCEAVSTWTDVGAVGGAWDMFDSTFVFEGGDTTNIVESAGGITDGATAFVSPNGGVRDATSQTGNITIDNLAEGTIAEFGNTTVTNGALTTVNLGESFFDPVVVASTRYPRTGTQRTPRIENKASSSFDIIVDNYDSSLTGTTNIDYVVFERGDWLVDDGGSGTRVYAGSVDTSVVAGQGLPSNPGGPVVTYPSPFAAEPAVLSTVVTRNDPEWLFSTVHGVGSITAPPSATQMQLFLNDNFDNDGHGGSETIDYIVFEQGNRTSNGVLYDTTTTGAATVSGVPVAVNYDTAYSSTPAVILVHALTQNGIDGGYVALDTDTAPTASAVTVAADEDGLGADRGHAAEEVAVVSFATSGTFTEQRNDLSEFVELEYSLQATGAALEGTAYCFRLTDAGAPLRAYENYPEATLSADVTVDQIGSQVASVTGDTTDAYIGGAFVIRDDSGSRNVTELTVSETGTVDAATDLANPRIAVDFDTTAPYDCASESYGGGEPVLNGSAFATANGSSTVTGSALISTTRSLCAYVLVDVLAGVTDGATIDFEITAPNNNVVVSAGTVGPGSAVALSGSTIVDAPSVTQSNYHWRNDDGDEAGATSATGGVENTPIGPIFQNTQQRLRFAVSNEGNAVATGIEPRLEYGTKVTSCENVGSWQRVDTGAAFDMDSTSQLTQGDDTTDVSEADGGVSEPNPFFVTPNAAQLESTDQSSAIALTTSEYAELEYALTITDVSAFGATYCFRLTDAGTPLAAYTNYPELTIQERQDFLIQRGTATVSGTSTTLTAGIDYDAPSANSAAFVRITNTSMTGAGSDTLGSTRDPDDLFAYIEGGDSLTSGFTIVRPPTATDNTRVSWEIIEFIGISGADNEMVVRDAGTVTYGGSDLFATGTAALGVVDDSDVVVFITGQYNPDGSTNNYNTGLSISSWNADTDQPVFERGDADGVAARVSYAVVEFTGVSWNVQRAEHTYTAAGVAETESISAVNSLLRTFVHAQKLSGDELFNLDESGHEVWLSSIGAVSFQLENGSTNPSEQTSVAWVIENTQTGDGSMQVYRSNGLIAQGGVQPITTLINIGATINPANATMWATNRSTGGGSAHPRAILGSRIINDTQYELWKSDEGQNQNFRVEIVEWPVAETSIRQTGYRFYVDNDALTPTDPWPVGASDLGENTAMTDIDQPLGEGERTRIRMGLFINNASLVADSASFKLQYARRVTSCSAVGAWSDVGDSGTGSIWRAVDATPVDGTELLSGASLLLSTSNVAGTYEENSPSASNPNTVEIGEYIEYDWIVENNSALQKSSYCFRMVESDGAVLNGYDVYPTVRTSGYTPIINNWQWFDDEGSLTPASSSASENVAPSAIANTEELKLRVSTTEIEGAPGNSIKFNLQYSQYPDFRDAVTLTSTTTCEENSLWCYADGAGDDNDILQSTVLSGVDSCVAGVGDGCGTRNEAQGLSSSYDQPAFSTSEHEFTVRQAGARVDGVYYFRLFDATNGIPLLASSSYPSVTTEGAILTFEVSGIDANTVTEGVTVDATTTPTSVDFGSIPLNTDVNAAQRLTVFTNGTEGYRVYMNIDQPLTNSYGGTLDGMTSTNAAPAVWASQCTGADTGCFGYHVGDNALYGGSLRFALDDTFAGVESGPVEVMASNVPVTFDVSDIVYRTRVGVLHPAGDYTSTIQYIVVPVF